MKRTFLHFLQLILLAICFITGCQGGKDTVSRLEEAENLIYESPDSALRLLESIPHPKRLQGKEQADYALLLSLARYRCYIPASSDSLIQIAVQYYKDKNDAESIKQKRIIDYFKKWMRRCFLKKEYQRRNKIFQI